MREVGDIAIGIICLSLLVTGVAIGMASGIPVGRTSVELELSHQCLLEILNDRGIKNGNLY